jgi:hypothetical protein
MPHAVVTVTADQAVKSANGKLSLILKGPPGCRATKLIPNYELLKDPKEPLALDIEFQEYRHVDSVKWGHRMGRISIVNTRGETIYGTYVSYDYDPDVDVKMPPARYVANVQRLSSVSVTC